MESAQTPSTDKWLKMLWYMHTMEYYSAIKKNILFIYSILDDFPGREADVIMKGQEEGYSWW